MNRLPEWYTAEMHTLDQALHGVWWRCPKHGVLGDPVVLGGDVTGEATAYCCDPECVERAVLVSRVEEDRNFNRPVGDKPSRRARATHGAVRAILEQIAAGGTGGVHWASLTQGGETTRKRSTVVGAIRDLQGYGMIERVAPGVWRATNGAGR